MKELIAEHVNTSTHSEQLSSTGSWDSRQLGRAYPCYVGIDQHAQWMVVAVAEAGRTEPVDLGRFENSAKGVKNLVTQLGHQYEGQVLSFCYEAGPCGYGLYRLLQGSGHDCMVVSPASIPVPSGKRRKTDRRDARLLARSLRNGDLEGIAVPDEDREAMRSLTRCRSDAKNAQRIARQQLQSFLLCHGKRYTQTQQRWTKTHMRWLADLSMGCVVLQAVLQDYVDAEERATRRLHILEAQMMDSLRNFSEQPWVYEMRALRGIDFIAAMTLVSELGDLRRFKHPRNLMAYLGLIPGEHSSENKVKRLSIGCGNRHVRRVLIEAAWCYRFTARKTNHIRKAMKDASAHGQSISWKAQQRLCGRYRHLVQRGKSSKKVTVAIARELCGFLWALYQKPVTA